MYVITNQYDLTNMASVNEIKRMSNTFFSGLVNFGSVWLGLMEDPADESRIIWNNGDELTWANWNIPGFVPTTPYAFVSIDQLDQLEHTWVRSNDTLCTRKYRFEVKFE